MRKSVMLSFFVIGLSACTGSGTDSTDEGEIDGQADTAVQIKACIAKFKDQTGGTRSSTNPAATNNDPIAKVAACAKNWKDAVLKISNNEPGCDKGVGFEAAIVDETSQLVGFDEGYRLVMNRECSKNGSTVRAANKLWFSPQQHFTMGHSGTPTTPTTPPDGGVPGVDGPQLTEKLDPIVVGKDVEIIAYDETKKAFNFYALEGGSWNYFGDSRDMLKGLPSGNVRRCAACHTGGGLIMKERRLPWMNWSNFSLTNAHGNEIVGQLGPKLGLTKGVGLFGGQQMEESFVDDSFQNLWNPTRLTNALAALSATDPEPTRALLRPVFCTNEMNLFTDGNINQAPLTNVPPTFLLDQTLSFMNLNIDPTAYTAAITGAKQQVVDLFDRDDKTPLLRRETAFTFAFAERSGADMDYTAKISGLAGQTSADFVKAALLTDFTRPVWSGNFGAVKGLAPGRCDLLANAPAVAADAAHPDVVMKEIRDGFVANLTAKGSLNAVEQTFLTNLKRTSGELSTAPELSAFQTACTARASSDPTGMAKDIVRLVAVNRRLARMNSIVESDSLFPKAGTNDDDLTVDANLRLDPTTCIAK